MDNVFPFFSQFKHVNLQPPLIPPQPPSDRRRVPSNRRWLPLKCSPIVCLNTELATGRPEVEYSMESTRPTLELQLRPCPFHQVL